MGMLLALIATAVPLAILPGLSFYFDVVPKIVILLIGIALALLSTETWRLPARSGFLKLIAIQAGATVLATVFSVDPAFSWFGSTWRKEGLPVEFAILIFGAAVFTWLSAEQERLRPFLRITVFGAALAVLYGIAQYFGIDPLLSASAYRVGEGEFAIVRPPSTLGHADYFATFLLYPAFAGFALAKLEADRRWKAAAIAAAALAVVAIVLSGTRAAIVGGVAGAILVLARGNFSRRRLVEIGAAAAIALAIFAAFYGSRAGERLRARVHWSQEDRLGGARILLWRDTLRMSETRWITGYGPESFVREFPKHESVELARAYPEFYHESPHNICAEAFVSKGIFGLAALLALAIFGLWRARGAIGGAFFAILVSQQFTSFTVATELYFYICLAILAAAAAPEAPVVRLPRISLRWSMATPFACFAIYLAGGDAMLAFANRELDRGNIPVAAKAVERARSGHASADIYFSRRFAAAGSDPASRLRSWESGFDAAKAAIDTADDRMNALVNLASFYAGENDAGTVEKTLRAAIAAAPNWYKPHWLLSRVLAAEGRAAEAKAEAQIAAELGGIGNATLASAKRAPSR